jgi:hypothetical protein
VTGPRDIDLHALVRDAVARHLAAGADAPATPHPASHIATRPTDASHQIYVTVVNGGDSCVIEPDLACTHCDYCRSHGH